MTFDVANAKMKGEPKEGDKVVGEVHGERRQDDSLFRDEGSSREEAGREEAGG